MLSLTGVNTNPVEQEHFGAFADSNVIKSWNKSQEEYSLKSLKSLSEFAETNQVTDFSGFLQDSFKDGRIDGDEVNGRNFDSWADTVAQLSGSFQEAKLNSFESNTNDFKLLVNTSVEFEFDEFILENEYSTTSRIEGVSDPLASDLGLEREINSCGFDNLAELRVSGSERNGVARGDPLTDGERAPGVANNKDIKILVTSDVTQYQNTTIKQFAGYVSEEAPSSPREYNDNYIAGTQFLPIIQTGQNVIINDDGAWLSNINRTISSECYLLSDLERTPSVEERILGNPSGASSGGVYTLIDGSQTGRDPAESNAIYERLNQSDLDLVEIEGVSSGEGFISSNFRLSRSLAQESGISDLIS